MSDNALRDLLDKGQGSLRFIKKLIAECAEENKNKNMKFPATIGASILISQIEGLAYPDKKEEYYFNKYGDGWTGAIWGSLSEIRINRKEEPGITYKITIIDDEPSIEKVEEF